MKQVVNIEKAVGFPLAHDITEIRPGEFKGAAFHKGYILQEKDLAHLRRLGKKHLYEDQIDIRAPLRAGASRDQLKAILVKSIARKKHQHEMRFARDQRLATQMVNIGG